MTAAYVAKKTIENAPELEAVILELVSSRYGITAYQLKQEIEQKSIGDADDAIIERVVQTSIHALFGKPTRESLTKLTIRRRQRLLNSLEERC